MRVSLWPWLLVVPLLAACTPGQYAGGAAMGAGGAMMIGGFTTETRCTRDHPCYQGNQPITSGSEDTRPRSVPVGVVGAALVVGGVVLLIAFAPRPPKRGPAPAADPLRIRPREGRRTYRSR